MAWGGVQLYPDPAVVPAFVQAVETVGEFAAQRLEITVGVDGFEYESELVETSHGAANRLVQALFAKQVASLSVASPPSPEEMIRFFAMVEQESVDLELDLPTRLGAEGLTAIRVRCHELLEDRLEDEEDGAADIERHPEVQSLFDRDSVQRVAERIMASSSPDVAAAEFVDTYRSAYEQVGAGDPAGLERVVQTFVDAFFRLDHSHRPITFEAIINCRGEAPFQNFLDQLSADELAELAGLVEHSALPLLVEYARVVSEMQGSDPGLVAKVMGDQEAGDARGVVAGTIGVHLAEFLSADATEAASFETIAAEVAGLPEGPPVGWTVLADLFAIEHRDDRIQRLLRIWVAKLGGAIKSGSLADAIEWAGIVRDLELDSRLVDEAYGLVASDAVLEVLTDSGSDHPELRDQLLQELSSRAGDRVLEQLATEDDPGRRHMLIDIVTEIARVDLSSVLPGLSDPRWYVVRNLTIARGKSGRKAAAGSLARITDHEDHRVRIEVLRALLLCLGPAAVDHLVGGLADAHERVRAAAMYLLSTLDDDRVVPALSAALRDEGWPTDARVAAVQALGRRSDDTADELLRQMAEARVRFSQSARVLRAAAREALRSGHA